MTTIAILIAIAATASAFFHLRKCRWKTIDAPKKHLNSDDYYLSNDNGAHLFTEEDMARASERADRVKRERAELSQK